MDHLGGQGWLTGQPIAHRGLHERAAGVPENSLAAFGRALRHGIPFEFDVQSAADGALVVIHDAQVQLPSGVTAEVKDLTRRQLDDMPLDESDERIPAFDEVLELVDGGVPIVIDVRRWTIDVHGEMEHKLCERLMTYRGPVALQSFDPLAVFRLKRLVGNLPVGQASGELRAVNPGLAVVGRTMVTNFLTRPDFISYQVDLLPTRWTNYWRSQDLPLLAFPIGSRQIEARARLLADNFFFSGYLPREYSSDVTGA